VFDDFRLCVALGHELADARKAYSHQGKFGGRKKAVQNHEHENADKLDQKHAASEAPKTHCSSRHGKAAVARHKGCVKEHTLGLCYTDPSTSR